MREKKLKKDKYAPVPAADYDRIEATSSRLGQSVAFHIKEAVSNYMADVFPSWEAKLKEVERDIRVGRKKR